MTQRDDLRSDPGTVGRQPRAKFVISVDTECDKGAGWLVRQPLAFRSSTFGIDECLEPVLRQFDAPCTYLISPEVIRDEASRQALERARAGGAELGCHLHGEFIEPERNDSTEDTQRMQSSYPPEIEEAKLRNLTELFAEHFGERPRSFRAGRFGIGGHSLRILSDLGYTVDSSVAPLSSWSDEGGKVSFYGCPDRPYHPSAADPLRRGRLPILEVPVTIGATPLSKLPAQLARQLAGSGGPGATALRILGRVSRRFRPTWLRPTWHSVEEMSHLMRSEQARLAGEAPVFVLMIHNVEAVAGCSPYNRTPEEAAAFLERLRGILDYAASFPVDFVGLSAVGDAAGNGRPSDGPSAAPVAVGPETLFR